MDMNRTKQYQKEEQEQKKNQKNIKYPSRKIKHKPGGVIFNWLWASIFENQSDPEKLERETTQKMSRERKLRRLVKRLRMTFFRLRKVGRKMYGRTV